MPQLDPTWFASQLFWLAVTFVLLYAMLSRFVLPPLQDIVARRKQTAASDIEQAQSLKSQADYARQEYERTLAEAREHAQGFMSDAMQDHKAKAELEAKDMDKQIEKQLAEAMRKIAARKAELLDELTPTAAELTGMIVEKLTQRRPGADQVTRILNEIAKGRN